MPDLSFPIGPQVAVADPTPEQRALWIDQIRNLPAEIRRAVQGLDDAQLDTPYRPGGWTVRQVVHHLADSHLHAYARFRFALTEDNPTIRPYDQEAWARLPDASRAPVELSLSLLQGMHARWAMLLDSLHAAQFARPLEHPELGSLTVRALLQTYAWHGRHHAAHITRLREREGWG